MSSNFAPSSTNKKKATYTESAAARSRSRGRGGETPKPSLGYAALEHQRKQREEIEKTTAAKSTFGKPRPGAPGPSSTATTSTGPKKATGAVRDPTPSPRKPRPAAALAPVPNLSVIPAPRVRGVPLLRPPSKTTPRTPAPKLAPSTSKYSSGRSITTSTPGLPGSKLSGVPKSIRTPIGSFGSKSGRTATKKLEPEQEQVQGEELKEDAAIETSTSAQVEEAEPSSEESESRGATPVEEVGLPEAASEDLQLISSRSSDNDVYEDAIDHSQPQSPQFSQPDLTDDEYYGCEVSEGDKNEEEADEGQEEEEYPELPEDGYPVLSQESEEDLLEAAEAEVEVGDDEEFEEPEYEEEEDEVEPEEEEPSANENPVTINLPVKKEEFFEALETIRKSFLEQDDFRLGRPVSTEQKPRSRSSSAAARAAGAAALARRSAATTVGVARKSESQEQKEKWQFLRHGIESDNEEDVKEEDKTEAPKKKETPRLGAPASKLLGTPDENMNYKTSTANDSYSCSELGLNAVEPPNFYTSLSEVCLYGGSHPPTKPLDMLGDVKTLRIQHVSFLGGMGVGVGGIRSGNALFERGTLSSIFKTTLLPSMKPDSSESGILSHNIYQEDGVYKSARPLFTVHHSKGRAGGVPLDSSGIKFTVKYVGSSAFGRSRLDSANNVVSLECQECGAPDCALHSATIYTGDKKLGSANFLTCDEKRPVVILQNETTGERYTIRRNKNIGHFLDTVELPGIEAADYLIFSAVGLAPGEAYPADEMDKSKDGCCVASITRQLLTFGNIYLQNSAGASDAHNEEAPLAVKLTASNGEVGLGAGTETATPGADLESKPIYLNFNQELSKSQALTAQTKALLVAGTLLLTNDIQFHDE